MYTEHPGGTRSLVTARGRKQLQTTFDDGTELIEEYDSKTAELLVRRWRTKTALGGWKPWEYEIGEPETRDSGVLVASSANPIFTRRDTPGAWEWRVRNLPYPKEVYTITVDGEREELVLRTTNKKYFKRFDVPALKRLRIPLDPAALRFEHSHNTLIIQYAKPEPVVRAEAQQREYVRSGKGEEGDVGCKQQ